jgi:hypothetical protein
MSTGQATLPVPRANEAAFSILETLCGMTFMFVGLLALASSTVTGMATKETNREGALATNAARRFLESMQGGEIPFEDLFAAYTRDQAAPEPEEVSLLDPAPLLQETTGMFVGSSGELLPILSRTFEVVELKPLDGQLAGAMGEIAFPVAEGVGGWELREDLAGRDLNGDGLIDDEDHAGDYRILPVTVRVQWKGARGARQFELHSLLVKR